MKKTILGLCIGLIIGLSTNAFAAIGDKVEAVFTEFVFLVDGEEKPLDATPLVYNGTSYLPVRTVANLVGKDVTYKADTKTIELTTPETEGMKVSEGIDEVPIKTGPTIAEQIAEIDIKVAYYGNQIRAWENYIKMSPEEDTSSIQADIEKMKSQISELEAKKAELQAQQ